MYKQPVFQAVYKVFKNHDLETDTIDDLKNNLKKKFEAVGPDDLCYNLQNQILHTF